MANRILLGAFPEGGGKFGLRVSRPGYNVASNPVDNEQLIFNSDWPAVLPIHQTGVVTLTAYQTVTVNYPTLGYSPHVSALVKQSGLDWQNYQMSNTLLIRTYTSGVNVVEKTAPDEFVYVGGARTNIQFRVFADRCTLYSSAAVQILYTIYHIKAFA